MERLLVVQDTASRFEPRLESEKETIYKSGSKEEEENFYQTPGNSAKTIPTLYTFGWALYIWWSSPRTAWPKTGDWQQKEKQHCSKYQFLSRG